jgi:hypothetical protein
MVMENPPAKNFTGVSALLMVAFILFIAGWGIENALPGTWSFSCKMGEVTSPDDIIQIGDTMVLAGRYKMADVFIIRVFKSHDGCTWTEIESPAPDDMWSCTLSLFRVLDDKLGIAWEETSGDSDKKPRSTFYWNTYDGTTWSEPVFLFSRDEPCNLRDAIMLEDGSLLIMWDEPLIEYTTLKGRIVRGSGCDVTYRAYINKDELIIDKVIEPENPSYCYIEGYSFIDDGERIWCVFYYGSYKQIFYRSWSQDGKQWSEPEPFNLSGPPSRQVLLTPQKEFGISCYDIFDGDFILFTSTDWETWSKERLLIAEYGIDVAIITTGNEELWGALETEKEIFLIQPSQELKQECQQRIDIITMLRYITLSCVIFAVVLALIQIRKRP